MDAPKECKHVLIYCGSDWEAVGGGFRSYDHALSSSLGRYHIGLVDRASPAVSGTFEDAAGADLVIGDAQDLGTVAGCMCLGNGVRLRYDLELGTCDLWGSYSGLPPVYRYRNGSRCLVSTSVALIASMLGGKLEFDERGIIELGIIGHPICGRTLFQNLELLNAGVHARCERGAIDFDTVAIAQMDELESWDAYSELMGEAISNALDRMDLSLAFLSLTAGLDTRLILSILEGQQRLIPACTLAGMRSTLDSERAAELCQRLGISHNVVYLNDSFRRELPQLAMFASLHSGGLTSVGEAHEVHYYNALGGNYKSRLSGCLGNQVGRSGTEGVSQRNVDLNVYASRVRGTAAGIGKAHWLQRPECIPDRAVLGFHVQYENLYAAEANYCIGHHYATQKSPYADIGVLLTKAREPALERRRSGSTMLRLRDLRHRFMGLPEIQSFQRSRVRRNGGVCASLAVNWGWKPCGGMTLAGTMQGFRAFADMSAGFLGVHEGPLAAVLRAVGAAGYGTFHDYWLMESALMRDYLMDLLDDTRVLDMDIFDREHVWRSLSSDRNGRRTMATRSYLLDVALACKIFTSATVLSEHMWPGASRRDCNC